MKGLVRRQRKGVRCRSQQNQQKYTLPRRSHCRHSRIIHALDNPPSVACWETQSEIVVTLRRFACRPQPQRACNVAPVKRRNRVVIMHREQGARSEEHTSELQSLMRISYAVFCLKKKKISTNMTITVDPNQ